VSTSIVSSPREARLVVETVLRDQCEHAVEIAQLLVSELVTNSMLHAGTSDVLLEVSLGPGRATLAVFDRSTMLPVVRHHTGPEAIGGKGLLLVERLAHAWGVAVGDEGKKVWVELPCDGHG
jgi:anti-sigma regulatory factor (Ser/Thr protein kinase)